MRRVEYSASVESDLDEIAAYIGADNPRRAVTFLREIREEIDRIGKAPKLHQLRPDIGPDARLAVVGRYVILYRMAGATVYVERVVHGNRLLPPLFQ